MILESGFLSVKTGQSADFEAAFRTASPIIASMKGYIRQAFGDAVVEKHLAWKRAADPAMILNADVVF